MKFFTIKMLRNSWCLLFIFSYKIKQMKKNTLFAIAILLMGCAASKIALTDVESANYKYAKTKFTDYSKEMFVQGKTINTNNCLKCHKQKDPIKFTEEQLNKIIPNMAK